MLSDRFGQLVIPGYGERSAGVRVENLHAGTGERHDLPVDAGRVHVANAPFAYVGEARGQLLHHLGVAEEIRPLREETRIVGALLVNQLAIALEHLGRRISLFRGDAQKILFRRCGAHAFP